MGVGNGRKRREERSDFQTLGWCVVLVLVGEGVESWEKREGVGRVHKYAYMYCVCVYMLIYTYIYVMCV